MLKLPPPIAPPAFDAQAAARLVSDTLRQTYPTDPLLGSTASYWTSVLRSAVSRHGLAIQRSIATALAKTGRFDVWTDVRIRLTQSALRVAAREARVPVRARYMSLDLLVFDRQRSQLTCAEVRRGMGRSDGRRRLILELELAALANQLQRAFRHHGAAPETTSAFCVDYYGRSGIKRDSVLTAAELDHYFQADVIQHVEAMTAQLRAALLQLTPSWLTLAEECEARTRDFHTSISASNGGAHSAIEFWRDGLQTSTSVRRLEAEIALRLGEPLIDARWPLVMAGDLSATISICIDRLLLAAPGDLAAMDRLMTSLWLASEKPGSQTARATFERLRTHLFASAVCSDVVSTTKDSYS